MGVVGKIVGDGGCGRSDNVSVGNGTMLTGLAPGVDVNGTWPKHPRSMPEPHLWGLRGVVNVLERVSWYRLLAG